MVATGKAASIGTFLPHLTTIVSVNAAGSPIEVRLPYLLAVWLVLGCLTITDEVADLLVSPCEIWVEFRPRAGL